MTRPHGTRAAYTINGCRCDDCREASRLYELERRNDPLPRLVSADPARAHVRDLMARGMGYKLVADVAGVSQTAVSALLYGKPGRPPTRRIRPSTAQALLAVNLDLSGTADGTRVDAAATHANVARLVAAGVPKSRIAERLGVQFLQLRPDQRQVKARTARIIGEMAAELDAGTLVTVRRSRHGDTVIAPPKVEVEERRRTFAESDEIDRFLNEMADIFYDKHQSWRADAACRGDDRPPWLWFAARGDRVTQDKARRICASCFVQAECLAYAESSGERTGMWAGVSINRYRRQNPKPRPCDHCDEPFMAETGQARMCSDECRHAARLATAARYHVRAS